MKEFIISHQEEGQRFDKYLVKCLPKAQKSFLYKMLRKKNIVLNGKKADGNEKIKAGDSVKIFFSDETFEKFSDEKTSVKIAAVSDEVKLDVLYEDDKFLIVNKTKLNPIWSCSSRVVLHNFIKKSVVVPCHLSVFKNFFRIRNSLISKPLFIADS